MPKKMRQKTRRTHFSGAKSGRTAICPTCRHSFAPTRKWQIFCSSLCRKKAFLKKVAKNATLANHERRLQAIERKLGIKKGE
jgi:hypothetical protein